MNCKKFAVDGRFYIYDRNTNYIVEVDKKTFELVNEKNGISAFIEKDFKREGNKSLEELKKYYEKYGLFKPFQVAGFKFDKSKFKKGMSHLILNIHENCNMRCKYCSYSSIYQNQKKYNSRRMDSDIAIKAADFFIKNVKNVERPVIGFYGGEPLLNFITITKVVEYAIKKKEIIDFSITTNGTLLTEEIVDFFIKHKFTVFVSLDGPPPIHNRYRVYKNGTPTFFDIYKKLEMIKRKNPEYYRKKVGFSIVFHPPYDKWDELYKFFTEDELVAVNIHIWSFVNPIGTDFYKNFSHEENKKYIGFFNNWRSRYEEYLIKENYEDKDFRFLSELFGKEIFRIHNLPKGEVRNKYLHPNRICYPGYYKAFVSPEGFIYPCEKVGYMLKVGDIFNGLNEDLIEETIGRYTDLVENMCKECWAVRLCNVCFISAITENGFDYERKKEFCKYTLSTLEKNIKSYIKIISKNREVFNGKKFRMVWADT